MRAGYSKEINDLFTLVNEKLNGRAPLEDIIETCNKILSVGRELNDDYIIGNGYFGLELAYFNNNLDDDMIRTHVHTVPHLIAGADYESLIRSYNNIGVISVSRNNFSNALENYLLAIDVCKTHKLKYREGITYCNLGDMYKCIGDYRHALNYYKKAIKLCSENHDPNPYFNSNLLLMYSGELFCYVKCNKYDEAKIALNKIDEFSSKAEDDYHLIAEIGAKFRYYMNLGNEVAAMELMDAFLKQLENVTTLHDFFVYILDICNDLYEKKHYEYIIKIAHIIESRMAFYEGCSPFLRGWIADYKIKYYKAINNEKHYYKALRSYHEAIERRNAFIKKFNKSIVDSQIKIEALTEKYRKTEESIEKLKLNAEHDQLTGLYNYGYIKDVLEEMFSDAAAKNEHLAVVIIDIDFFKQYNDTYGHQEGDLAIKAVADVLKSVSNDNIIPSRYGGDEFIILIKDMTDDAVIDVCNSIRKSVEELNIEHTGSAISDRLSVSIGARNSVPHKANKSWDYLYAADMALYDVKEFKKGGLQLVHRYLTPKSKAGNKDNKVTIM